MLESIRPYLDWQTTIEYLKNPPAEYAANIQPPYDFYANFGRIYNNAVNGSYDNEYAFGFDLYRCFQIAHDGHFAFYPDSVTSIFTFGRTTPLVSVSVDGVGIPEVYAYADVLSASFGNVSFTPSPLTMIDGENSTEWLLDFSQYGSLQDRDALWNNVFYELAQVSLGASGSGTGTFSGGGRGRYIYPGPTTSLTFANGTNVTIENFARVLVPFKGITNGDDIYKTYFTPPPSDVESAEQLATMTTSSTSSSATASTTSSTSSTSIPAPGYPSPIVREKRNLNSGYFLDGEGYDDVVVLSVPSFVGNASDERPFQSVNTYTINRALAANKTKLIIDVSANGGGTILQGYDLFKQLFPHILPYGATRFRAHEAFDLIGQEVSYYSGLVPRSPNTNETVQNLVSTSWNYRTDADVNYRPFTSWAEKFGPHAYGPGPDNFTSIIRWNLSDVLTPDNSGGIYVSGYLNRTNITTQPFAAEDIVIVYDGYCASDVKPRHTPRTEPLLTSRQDLHHLLRAHAPTSRRQDHRPRRPSDQGHHPSRRRRQRHQRLPLDLHPLGRRDPLPNPLPAQRRLLQQPHRAGPILRPPAPPLHQRRRELPRRPPAGRRHADAAAVPLRAGRLPDLLYAGDGGGRDGGVEERGRHRFLRRQPLRRGQLHRRHGRDEETPPSPCADQEAHRPPGSQRERAYRFDCERVDG